MAVANQNCTSGARAEPHAKCHRYQHACICITRLYKLICTVPSTDWHIYTGPRLSCHHAVLLSASHAKMEGHEAAVSLHAWFYRSCFMRALVACSLQSPLCHESCHCQPVYGNAPLLETKPLLSKSGSTFRARPLFLTIFTSLASCYQKCRRLRLVLPPLPGRPRCEVDRARVVLDLWTPVAHVHSRAFVTISCIHLDLQAVVDGDIKEISLSDYKVSELRYNRLLLA